MSKKTTAKAKPAVKSKTTKSKTIKKAAGSTYSADAPPLLTGHDARNRCVNLYKTETGYSVSSETGYQSDWDNLDNAEADFDFQCSVS